MGGDMITLELQGVIPTLEQQARAHPLAGRESVGLASAHVSDFEKTPPEVRELLGKPISQLGLKLEGSPVERFVHQLHRELERKGLRRFKPRCYLTDEWGCPDGQPVIGIPFYLADPKLARL